MSQFHNIFCTSTAPLTRAEIADHVVEGWYEDGNPTFTPTPDGNPTWDRLEITIPGVRRPVLLLNDTDPQAVRGYVDEVLNEPPAPLTPAVADRLRASRRVVGIELAPELLNDDAWELLDTLQSFLATRLDGILVTHDGIYDHQLHRLQ